MKINIWTLAIMVFAAFFAMRWFGSRQPQIKSPQESQQGPDMAARPSPEASQVRAMRYPPAAPSASAGAASSVAPAAPAPAPVQNFGQFNIDRDMNRLAQKKRDILATNRNADFHAIDGAIIKYAQCKTIIERSDRLCSFLSSLSGGSKNQQACSDVFQRTILWKDLSLGKGMDALDRSICRKMVDADNADPDSFCNTLEEGWRRRDENICARFKGASGARLRGECDQFFEHIFATPFRARSGMEENQLATEFFAHHLWHRSVPNCDKEIVRPWYGETVILDLRRGACIGVFKPKECEKLLVPVNDFLQYN